MAAHRKGMISACYAESVDHLVGGIEKQRCNRIDTFTAKSAADSQGQGSSYLKAKTIPPYEG